MEPFVHLPQYGVVICVECKHAVLPNNINAHLRDKDKHNITKQDRQRVIQEIQMIEGLKITKEEISFPPPRTQPISILQKPRIDGMKCQLRDKNGEACQYISCHLQQIQEHCRDVHQWVNKQKRGRPEKGSQRKGPWTIGVHCQHFFKRGPGAQYFEVAEEQSITETRQGESQPPTFEAIKQELEQELKEEAEKARRQIAEPEEAREPNPWLRRVGWVPHLASLDRAEIKELVASVEDDEPELQILSKAFDWLIQDAQYHAVREVVGQQAMFEANKKEVDKEAKMPFDSWMDITTVKRYTIVWKQLLWYTFRAEDDEPNKRPPYELTQRQQMCMAEVRDVIREFQSWKQEQEPIPEPEPQPIQGSQPGTSKKRKVQEEEEESDEEIKWMQKIQREILRLCIAMLNQPLQDNEYESVIISGMALLGMREDDGWLDAEDYTPKYSAVIKLARLMVIQEAYQQRQEKIQSYESQGWASDEAKRQAPSCYRLVRRMMEQFMTMAHNNQDPTPMQWLFQSRTYGFKIRYTTTAQSCIQWMGDTILYQQIQFSMSQVRCMVHGLVEEARELLFCHLMMVRMNCEREVDEKQIPPINWEQLRDNPAETRVDWSFLDDERSQFAVDGQWWLYRRIHEETRLQKQFMDEHQQLQRSSVVAYQGQVERFQELLLILMHMCGGQPARAPELLGIRWENTAYGGVRNIFVENGLVAFVTTYHKGYRSSGNIKIIHRYLPREVGELLVYYLWLVVPFHDKVQFKTTKCRHASPFLWGDGAKKEHRQWTGPKRRMRTEEIEEEATSQNDQQGEDEPSKPLLAQRQARAWTSERVRKIMQESSERWMGVRVNISAWRHIAIAISRRFCQEDRFHDEKSKLEEDAEWDEDNIEGDDAWDLQAGHGTHVAGMIYAREMTEGDNSIVSRREKFRRVSHAWHCLLGFASAHQGVGMSIGAKWKRHAFEEEMQDAQLMRWKRLRSVDIHRELEQMLGDGSQFRGLQESALRAIMKNESPILVIMGTGAGKSMLFMLPAHSMSSGTTVVIVPLVSLKSNLAQRCQAAHISCVEWDNRQTGRVGQIVLVTPESAVSKTFGTFLDRLQGLHQLDRIVIDECHTVLDSGPEFRPKMRELGQLSQRGVQMVFLTATLPPHSEPEFMEIMKVREEDIRKFRGPTIRPNIAYSVVEYDGELNDAIHDLVKRKLDEYPAPAKIVVYSSSIKTTQELCVVLDCHAYYREVGSRQEKDKIAQQFHSGDGQVIVATNAFGLGIDEPDIHVVIHVGIIHQMQGYAQESGRAGRNGKRSEAIIMIPVGQQDVLQKRHQRAQQQKQPGRVITADDKKRVEREKVEKFIIADKCRRIYLDQEMDGRVDRVRCEEGEELCDICQKDNAMLEEAEALRQAYIAGEEEEEDSGIGITCSRQHSPMASSTALVITNSDRQEFQAQQAQQAQQQSWIVEQNQEEAQAIWDLENRLDMWVGKCVLCYVRQHCGQAVDTRHKLEECKDDLHQLVAQEVEVLRGIQFARYASCYSCGVPQKICMHWEAKEGGNGGFQWVKGGMCQYSNVVQCSIAAIMVAGPGKVVDEQVYSWMKAQGIWGSGEGLKEEEVEGVKQKMLEWCGRKVIWGGMEGSILIQVFYRLVVGMEKWRRENGK